MLPNCIEFVMPGADGVHRAGVVFRLRLAIAGAE